MSLALDLDAIRERFVDQWDDQAVTTVFANGDLVDPDETEPFVRFSINPGSRAIVTGENGYSQIGRVWLQIFVPPSEGTMMGYDLADQFTAIYRNWISPDQCVQTWKEHIDTIPNGSKGMFQINVSIEWESIRWL